jgi:hypothetical protein
VMARPLRAEDKSQRPPTVGSTNRSSWNSSYGIEIK